MYQQRTNRQKQSKDSQNSKNDHWCTNRHMSIKTVPTAYQSSKTVNNSQKTVKSAKITIGVPIVTMSTQSPPNTQSPRLLCVCSTLGLANRAVSPSQSEGVRVVAELRHSSTDHIIGTVTSTLGLRAARAPESARNCTSLSRDSYAKKCCEVICLRDLGLGILTQGRKGVRSLNLVEDQTKLSRWTGSGRGKS